MTTGYETLPEALMGDMDWLLIPTRRTLTSPLAIHDN